MCDGRLLGGFTSGYVGERAASKVSLVIDHTLNAASQNITTLVETDEGTVACTRWNQAGPADDPFAADPEAL